MGSGEDAGTENIANVVFDSGSGAVVGTGACNSSGDGTVVKANSGASAWG